MGSKMVVSEEKANECKNIKNFINQSLNIYSQRVKEFKAKFEDLEKHKFQSIVDALNRIIIFETSCDMNNKYDVKGMASLVENLDQKQYTDHLHAEINICK